MTVNVVVVLYNKKTQGVWQKHSEGFNIVAMELKTPPKYYIKPKL